jgi:hypothetical protein
VIAKPWHSIVIAAVLASGAGLAHAQTWTVDALDTIGCGDDETSFATTVAGASGIGPERWRSVVRTLDNRRFMDQDAGVAFNGVQNWELYTDTTGGPINSPFPLPPNQTIIVNFMFISGPGGPIIFNREVRLSQCNGGTIVSNQVVANDLPPFRPDTSAVPLLGPVWLLWLAALVGVAPLLARRRRLD